METIQRGVAEKPVLVFDFAAYNEMGKTNNALRKIVAETAAQKDPEKQKKKETER